MILPRFARRLGRRLHPEARGFARDSALLSVASGVAMAGYMTQIALVTRWLGIEEYGVLALAAAFTDIVSRVFDVRVGETVIAFGAERLDREPRAAAGVFRFGYAIDFGAGAIGFLLVAALAPFAGDRLAGDAGPLVFFLYGLVLLATTVETTSLAILRMHGRFGWILRLTVLREILRVGSIVLALAVFGTLAAVIVALILLETLVGGLAVVLAARAFAARTGIRLASRTREPLAGVRRAMLRMMFHANLIGYAKIVPAQGPTMLLGALRDPAEVGIFKIGMAVASAVGKPADPAWAAVMPRLARLRADRLAAEALRLVRQSSLVLFAVIAIPAAVAVALRGPILELFGGTEARAAGAVLVLACIGRLVNGTLFWNTPVLYAYKRAGVASRIFLTNLVVFAPLLVVLTTRWGATGAAAAGLVWTVLNNAALAVAAIRAIRERSDVGAPRARAEAA